MSMPAIPDANIARLRELQNSEEYQQRCQEEQEASERLTAIAQRLLTTVDEIKSHCECNTAYKEYASGSSLHRGFYCPSPVFDIVTGNTHRGKILKRITSRSKPTHAYGFQEDGRLLWCQNFCNGKPGITEYLVYEADSVYGITLDTEGSLRSITEEAYACGRIIRYSFGTFLHNNGNFFCCEISSEYYGYDSEGLLNCELRNMLIPPQQTMIPESMRGLLGYLSQIPLCRRRKYRFERKEGYLVSYTNGENQYQVLTQRKA